MKRRLNYDHVCYHSVESRLLHNTLKIRRNKTIFRRMVSSGMLRRVALVRADVLEEPGASFIRVTKIGELGTTQAATSNRRTLRRNAWYFFAAYVGCSQGLSGPRSRPHCYPENLASPGIEPGTSGLADSNSDY
jgi:hypothetical protein